MRIVENFLRFAQEVSRIGKTRTTAASKRFLFWRYWTLQKIITICFKKRFREKDQNYCRIIRDISGFAVKALIWWVCVKSDMPPLVAKYSFGGDIFFWSRFVKSEKRCLHQNIILARSAGKCSLYLPLGFSSPGAAFWLSFSRTRVVISCASSTIRTPVPGP